MLFGWRSHPGGHRNRTPWHRWYAWRPVRLMDGRWVWREWVDRAGYFLPAVEPHVHGVTLWGSWVHRLPLTHPEQ